MTALAKQRRRTRTRRDGPLQLATRQLHDAIDDLIDPRYHDLRSAIDVFAQGGVSGGHGRRGTPCWIDALKLVIVIDDRTHALHGIRGDTPTLWRRTARKTWRPQDVEHLEALTAELHAWCQAIDDLFTAKPAYLPDPCPHCRQTHTYRSTDDGQRVRTPALAVTVERTWCQACHDEFNPFMLAQLLGYLSREIQLP